MENSKEDSRSIKRFMAGLIVVGILSIAAPFVVAFYTNYEGGVSGGGGLRAEGYSLDIQAVTSNDRIRGSDEGLVKIVSYSDFYCPFCEQFHQTIGALVDEYEDGQVAWVYRHLPVGAGVPEQSFEAARASECAFDQGGDGSFWQFADTFYERVKGSGLSTRELSVEIADDIGLDLGQFSGCVDSEKFDDRIDEHTADAYANGGTGTPWSVVVAPDGTTYPVTGSQPIQALRQVVNLALEKQ